MKDIDMNKVDIVSGDQMLSRHDDIDSWVTFFNERAGLDEIFNTTITSLNFKSRLSSRVIGNKWLQFSILMPKILCLLASKVDSNQARMRILKIAWEELGEGKAKHIHPETFRTCLQIADVNIAPEFSFAITELEKYAEGRFNSTSEIFGLGLGLEITAMKNIETIFNGLAYDSIVSSFLQKSEFFQIHFQNEEGHIKHCVESFIKYCPDAESQADFILGFDSGVRFWKLFWGEVADKLVLPNSQSVAWAN
jgi:Iron-containing redox enzyme